MDATLTDRQTQVLAYIVDVLERHGAPPTVREIADRFGFASPGSVQRHLDALEKKGFLTRREGLARGIELDHTRVRELFGETDGIPLVGRVAAGRPIVAEENIEDILNMDGLFPSDMDLFALRVEGESMIDAGIFPNDIVIVRPQPTAEAGDVVAALVDDEGTIKRLGYQDNQPVLEPANANYRPIVSDDIRVVGVVVGLVRQIRSSAMRRWIH